MTKNISRKILLFTSVYPLPWQRNKATFNFQQYSKLADKHEVDYLVPVPWLEYFQHFFTLIGQHPYKHVCYFPFFYIPGVFRSLNNFLLVLSIIISIVPFIKLCRAKTVLASWAFPDALACAWLKPVCRYKLFIQCLGSDVNVHSENSFRRKLLAKSFAIANGVITVSQALNDKVKSICESANVRTIYNGVNFDKFVPSDDKFAQTSLIFIGNIIKTKGVYELIGAVKKLKEQGTDFHLHMVGNGPEIDGIKKLIGDLDLSSTVTVHGTIDHGKVVNLLQKCHALVLPSYREGVPNVIMESLACGVPVVATAVGGIPEVVNQQNGQLIPHYDEDNIAQGIATLLATKHSAADIRASISSYTWQANIDQLSNYLFKEAP
ncbi:glycosyltransferase [Thalassotalea sp. PLHSN55]|uniref:glycosyltransferase n=1 Tax=Thalassotalea sp. PLHSN55 TaxID=3435888 RepID=UPI003F83BDFA